MADDIHDLEVPTTLPYNLTDTYGRNPLGHHLPPAPQLTYAALWKINHDVTTEVFGVACHGPNEAWRMAVHLERAYAAIDPDAIHQAELDKQGANHAQYMYWRQYVAGWLRDHNYWCPCWFHFSGWKSGALAWAPVAVANYAGSWPNVMAVRDWAASDAVRWSRFTTALEEALVNRGARPGGLGVYAQGWRYGMPVDICRAAIEVARMEAQDWRLE